MVVLHVLHIFDLTLAPEDGHHLLIPALIAIGVILTHEPRQLRGTTVDAPPLKGLRKDITLLGIRRLELGIHYFQQILSGFEAEHLEYESGQGLLRLLQGP